MKVLIVKKAFNGKSVGEITGIISNNDLGSHKKNRFFKNLTVLNLPNELEGKDIKVVILSAASAFWSKGGKEDVYTEPFIAQHWIKNSDVVWTAPMTIEDWVRGGDSVLTQPMTEEKWVKENEADVTVQPMTVEKWTKDGEEDLLSDPVDDSWTHVESVIDISWTHEPVTEDDSWAHRPSIVDPSWTHILRSADHSWAYTPAVREGDFKIELDSEKDKIDRTVKAKADLEKDLYIEMSKAYGTSNPVSATSNYLTWLSMVNAPDKFSGAGLKARFNGGTIKIGDTLNTDAKILEYAVALLDISDDYAVYREQKIQEFMIEAQAIQAE